MTHVFLFDLLDGDFEPSALFTAHPDQPELAFAEGLLKSIIVKDIRVAHDSLQRVNPLLLLLLSIKIEAPNAVGRDRNIDRKELAASFGASR